MLATAMHNRAYPSDGEYLDALGEAVAVEYEAAVTNGLILQIDAPDLAMERHLTFANRSCLLYTSPSPRDKRQSRMPSSA